MKKLIIFLIIISYPFQSISEELGVISLMYHRVGEGKYPSIYALSVFLLFLPPVKKAIYKLIDQAGHGELLVVSGLFFALGAGYEFFYSVDLKGDLGALILGILISNHTKSKVLAKSLLSFKEFIYELKSNLFIPSLITNL